MLAETRTTLATFVPLLEAGYFSQTLNHNGKLKAIKQQLESHN
jgi:hypothetical protein